jgi:hypothetical protein
MNTYAKPERTVFRPRGANTRILSATDFFVEQLERFQFHGNAALSRTPLYEPTNNAEAIPYKPESTRGSGFYPGKTNQVVTVSPGETSSNMSLQRRPDSK